ncbi:MAG: hypothetical protein JJE44_03620 [Flavobacteriaceae bacterium]|nr:hypothetical protein [Flavobacteriaceae bacterium]
MDDNFYQKVVLLSSKLKIIKLFILKPLNTVGHVRFNATLFGKDLLWSEKRIFKFLKHHIS